MGRHNVTVTSPEVGEIDLRVRDVFDAALEQAGPPPPGGVHGRALEAGDAWKPAADRTGRPLGQFWPVGWLDDDTGRPGRHRAPDPRDPERWVWE